MKLKAGLQKHHSTKNNESLVDLRYFNADMLHIITLNNPKKRKPKTQVRLVYKRAVLSFLNLDFWTLALKSESN